MLTFNASLSQLFLPILTQTQLFILTILNVVGNEEWFIELISQLGD